MLKRLPLLLLVQFGFVPFSQSASCSEVFAGTEFRLQNYLEIEAYPVEVAGKLATESQGAVTPILKKYEGKWLILDVSATWCGYCKMDQVFYSAMVNPGKLSPEMVEFHAYAKQEGFDLATAPRWDVNKVSQVHLTVEMPRDDVYNQTFPVVRRSLTESRLKRDQVLTDDSGQPIDRTGIDTYFYEKPVVMKDTKFVDIFRSGKESLFEGMRGYPFQVVFNPKGEVVFRGHFTKPDETKGDVNWWDAYYRHYQMLDRLIRETN